MLTRRLKKISFTLLFTCIALVNVTAQHWKMQPVSIETPWAKEVSPSNVLPEYPRPQMTRKNWQNLNGLWEYAITNKDDAQPSSFDGHILVPYPIESALSGVKKSLLPDQRLWYKRTFVQPKLKKGERVLLHFGAVDQVATVFINGKEIGKHSGGYDAFNFDITGALIPGNNELIVSAWDPTDKGDAPHGKQTLRPRAIFYTAVSGIWQTVWLETVPAVYVSSLKMTADIDHNVLDLKVNLFAPELKDYQVEAIARKGTTILSSTKSPAGKTFQVPVFDPHLWSPSDPFLYDLTIKLFYKGKLVDTVGSYFGMRKIDIQKDERGMERIFLNNKYTYNLGVLDQGYFPDGLYTAPTDDALKYDIQAIKDMGFNTIRKHIKIEPARWYYHCDKLGMLVWQDMPSWRQGRDIPQAEHDNFEKECAKHLEQLHNYPSIIAWVLYNENWGSTPKEQIRLTQWMKKTDPSRLINGHSGPFVDLTWEGADMVDLHTYPDPNFPGYQKGKVTVCGEFGGTFMGIDGHEWVPGKGWGHPSPPGFNLKQRYELWMRHLKIFEEEGLSASIFTEPYDVETEENGILTYDRKVWKIPAAEMKQLNQILSVNN